MEDIIKQHNSDLNSCDTAQPHRVELDGLFARVSPSILQAKVELGGDFIQLTTVC